MTGYDERAAFGAQRMMAAGSSIVLAIETSCDETAAAVVKNGREVLSNAVYSQIPIHEKFGGVVPEVASRNHVLQLTPTVEKALCDAKMTLDDVEAIAVTSHPGLVGALLTGVSYAKGLAYARSLPLVGVDHIAGHIAANYLTFPDLKPPFIALVASGGHSHVFLVERYTQFQVIGKTRDDAAGEAFDKVARVLGLPYPGGPSVERLAMRGDRDAIAFPSPFHDGKGYDFSFSGLKTAVIQYMNTAKMKKQEVNIADVAASFQHSVAQALTKKTIAAAKNYGLHTVALCGGVSANETLRQSFFDAAQKEGLRFVTPALAYSGDNAAMIGCAGHYMLMAGQRDGLSLNAVARNAYQAKV